MMGGQERRSLPEFANRRYGSVGEWPTETRISGYGAVYLKRKYRHGRAHYILRESYLDGKCWKCRNLMDLGQEPGSFIEYPGGNGFYLHEVVEDTLRRQGAHYSDDELEAVFIPFLRADIRRIVERFSVPSNPAKRWRSCSQNELMRRHRELHFFDKRRLHYLRCGRVEMGDLDSRPWKFLNVLLDKSRDEIEALFEVMEQQLPPHEIRPYLYTALQMQTHFRHLLTRNQPAALDPEKIDHYFVEDLCRLNRDERFFRGVEPHDLGTLHPYLVKYLIMFFDHAFDPRSVWAEYAADFRWRHQFYREPPHPHGGMSPAEQEACQVLGISLNDFQKMDRPELSRCYRHLAKKAHPDRGGDDQAFVTLKAAYEFLLRRKS